MNTNDEFDELYDAVIVGGGISGLVTAYMLRDQNVLLLEKEGRVGGRVQTATAGDVPYNIGTQFFTEADTSFVHLVDELGIERIHHDPMKVPAAIYLDGVLHDGLRYFMKPSVLLAGLKVWSKSYRTSKVFQRSPGDPRWRELAARDLAESQQADPPSILKLVNTYLRAACVSKPERTSAGIGAVLTLDIFSTGQMAFVTGGTQRITDEMAARLGGKVIVGAEVADVTELDGVVTTRYRRDGAEHTVRSRAAVMATPPMITLDLVPDLPDWKRQALERVDYGPIIVVSLFFDRDIPWQRWYGMLCDDTVFSGAADATYGTVADENPANPIICNFFLSIPPDEKDDIRELLAKSDDEIISLVVGDFKRIMSGHDVDRHLHDARVARYPIGELELSPVYYLDVLPYLPTPVGNIHFCGDYTDPRSFLEGAALSGFRAARELGSRYVVSEEDEIAFPNPPRWGAVGLAALGSAALLAGGGLLKGGGLGLATSVAGGALFGATAAFPFFLPPNRSAYKVLLGGTVLIGGLVGSAAWMAR
jgi:phytoene dehydrogenase-like protein